MAANTVPIFPIAPVVGVAYTIATLTARTNITGVSGLTLLYDGTLHAEGTRIDKITVVLVADPADAIVFIWWFDGTTSSLWKEIPIVDTTPSNTVPAGSYSIDIDREVLPGTCKLYATTTIGQNTNVFMHGAYY